MFMATSTKPKQSTWDVYEQRQVEYTILDLESFTAVHKSYTKQSKATVPLNCFPFDENANILG